MTAPEHRTVLVVDDEEHVRDALTRLLAGAGYLALAAEDAKTALRILADRPVQLLISDNHMPGMSGIELLKEARRRHPHMLRIMLTADKDPDLAVRSINEGEVYRFLRKPWSNADVLTVVHLAFEVLLLEDEKRQLLDIVRRYREARERGEPATQIEAELLLLGESELIGDET
ncbi:MAG: response regulator [Myxococcales bacterium]